MKNLQTLEEFLNENNGYSLVKLKLSNGKIVELRGTLFQSKRVPDPHTSKIDIVRAINMLGYNNVTYKVLDLVK